MLVDVDIDNPRWTAFVEASPHATPFHRPEWAKLLSECYGFRAFALVLVEGGEVRAGVPAIEVRSALGRRRWVSLPFTDACPPLWRDGSANEELATALEETRIREHVRQVEVRSPLPGRVWSSDAGYLHTLELDSDPGNVFATFKRTRVQQRIEKGQREGVVVERGTSVSDVAETFYRLHVSTRRRLGVPVQPRRYFDLLWRHVLEPGLGFVLIAKLNGVPIAGAVFLSWNGTIVYKYSASRAEFWNVQPNHLVIWTAIELACREGYRVFDFGRTEPGNEGLRTFKGGWSTTERPLVYSTLGNAPSNSSGGKLERGLRPIIRRSPAVVCRVLGEMFYRYAA